MAGKQYKALKPLGRWAEGETIGALPIAQILQLESDGIIKAIEEKASEEQIPKAEVKQPNKKQVGENNVEA
ncbi:hypothetical protein F895_02605 [Acinetobacter sp. CIP 64.2]|uniref:hypothetical protein n=1 Tax=Acinetobacter sp. CIP 64.2 TaxID=1217694 RepID=UPI0002897388|nr:hypothetical protein [Acinetobacter sp. CIP 64.2]ENX13301.1 hypothetical protein F895_02605 [Acinetobacter sp. CIP 64.2]